MAQQKQLVLPDTFSGRSHDDFDIWVSQFDLAAAVNQWSQVTKLQMLPLRLKGPALRAFHAIPAEDRRTYAKAIDALQNRFSPVERQSVHRAALRSRRRKPDEDLSELADDVLLLAGRAYPGMDSDALDQLALEAFLDALDVQLRRRVRDADPETLNAAVSRALVLDAYDEADRRSGLSTTQAQRSTRHGQPALAAASVDPPRESPSVSDTVLQNLLSTQQQILQSLERLSVQQQRAPREPSAPVPPRTIVCFSCGEEGHMRSSCPRFPSRDRRQDSSRPPRQSSGAQQRQFTPLNRR